MQDFKKPQVYYYSIVKMKEKAIVTKALHVFFALSVMAYTNRGI